MHAVKIALAAMKAGIADYAREELSAGGARKGICEEMTIATRTGAGVMTT